MAKKKAVKKTAATKRKVAKKKTSKLNKSAEAKTYLEANPDVKVADAVIALNEKFPGENFVAANVYQAKNGLKGGTKKKPVAFQPPATEKRPVAFLPPKSKANLHSLAAQLLKSAGSADAAKAAIDDVAAVVEAWEKAPF